MSRYARQDDIDIGALGFPATSVCADGLTTVTADVDDATLKAAVDAAPLRADVAKEPTDLERLAAVLVTKVDTLTEADVAKALGVHEDRVTAASAELSAEVAIEAAPIKGVTR